MDGGLFKGKVFPTPAECEDLNSLLTWDEGVLQGDNFILWVYYCLGTSSFFNDLFGAAHHVLRPNPNGTNCEYCHQTPCVALNSNLPPSWIIKLRTWQANISPESLRYKCYKECHPKIGHARVPLPDCWLLAIRLALPGGQITGFKPRYLKAVRIEYPEIQIPALVLDPPVVVNHESDDDTPPEDPEDPEDSSEDSSEEDSSEDDLSLHEPSDSDDSYEEPLIRRRSARGR